MALQVFLVYVLFTAEILRGHISETVGLEVSLGFVVEPSDVIAVRNQPLQLPCTAKALSSNEGGLSNVTWTHQELLVINDARRRVLPNGSLYFEKVLHKRSGRNQSDKGEYRCYVHNSLGVLVSRPAQVDIAVLPQEFTNSPDNETVEEGDATRFWCQIASVPDAVIVWEKDGAPLPQNNRYIIPSSGVLQITSIQQEDAGSYRCLATNSILEKERFSSEGLLRVVPSSGKAHLPQFLSQPLFMHEREGQDVLLECLTSGWPSPVLSWTFSHEDERHSQPTGITKAQENNLLISEIRQAQAGIYTCQINSQEDISTATQVVQVEVFRAPYFTMIPVSQVFPTARTVRFECEARGYPTPKILWLKNGEVLRIDGRVKHRGTELVLSNTVASDSGIYQCTAQNEIGYRAVAARLLVNTSQNQPDSPHNLECHTESSTKISLSWEKPRIPGILIMAYTIHYLPTDGGDEDQIVESNTSRVVDRLKPHTSYTFYVRAYSNRSASEQSEKVTCTTGEDVPLTTAKVTLEAVSPNTAHVTWEKIPDHLAQGVITEYKIQWRRRNQPSSNVDEVRGDVLDYTITGLQPGKRYEVRVFGATSQGWPTLQESSSWTTIEMPLQMAQTVPVGPIVQLVVVNISTIEVTWNLPKENKYKPTSYKLYYRKENHQLQGPISISGDLHQHILTDLESQTLYEVHVQGSNQNGDGDVAVKSIQTLAKGEGSKIEGIQLIGNLEPPSHLQAVPSSSTSVALNWLPPTSVHNITFYTIRYHLVTALPSNSTLNLDRYIRSTSSEVEVDDLKPYTVYEFSVSSHDVNNQQGPYSQKVECRTGEDVPGPPYDFNWQPLNSNCVILEWNKPLEQNGIVLSYSVYYTDQPSQDLTKWKIQLINGSLNKYALNSLMPNTHYSMYIYASTGAGIGKQSLGIIVTLSGEKMGQPSPSQDESILNTHIGITVGVILGICCMVICGGLFMYRHQHPRPNDIDNPPTEQCNGNIPNRVNGNGCCKTKSTTNIYEGESHEFEVFLPKLAALPQTHIDTKGGYPNGYVNGMIKCQCTSDVTDKSLLTQPEECIATESRDSQDEPPPTVCTTQQNTAITTDIPSNISNENNRLPPHQEVND